MIVEPGRFPAECARFEQRPIFEKPQGGVSDLSQYWPAPTMCLTTFASTRPALARARPTPVAAGEDGLVMLDVEKCVGCHLRLGVPV